MQKNTIAYIPSSHLDLFWLGNYKTCLERGSEVIKQYLDRCLANEEETFLLETVVFAEDFLRRYPKYIEHVRHLYAKGQLEIGAAYVDRWETLIPGESQIRNIVRGKRWCKDILDIDNPMVTHPDLPSMTPQIAQLYAQAGIKYYVTSRKIFEHGQVWRYRSPDGSAMLVLNYPQHYTAAVLPTEDIPNALPPDRWVRTLDFEASLCGFPQGTVAVAGGAGDLADLETFRERFGCSLNDLVERYRTDYPDVNFSYTLPSKVLADYEQDGTLPERSGAIPSVWGVAADEEVQFFQRDRRLEATLLTAETAVVAAQWLGIAWRPNEADWQGTFFEDTFFARKDPILEGQELNELWRMHIFTQDHNGGGQEGALSTFQKRTIQYRCQQYAEAITDTFLDRLAAELSTEGDGLLVFNPHGQRWSGPIILEPEALAADVTLADEAGRSLPTQELDTGGRIFELSDLPPVGYRFYPFTQQATPSSTSSNSREVQEGNLIVQNEALELVIDQITGNLTLHDKKRYQSWNQAPIGRIYTVEEDGNDVTLRVAAEAKHEEAALEVIGEVTTGSLFQRVRISKTLLKCQVEQTYTLWNKGARLDLEVRLYWWGKRHQQVRLGLPSLGEKRAIFYGSPFYGCAWNDVVEDAAPRNHDEILLEDYARYREVQDWLHLGGEQGGLTIGTTHPAFYHDDRLEAVLLRTSPSCGDARFFWDNAGEQVFTFSFFPGKTQWREADAARLALALHKQPVVKRVSTSGGTLPRQQSLFAVEGALLSALYPGVQPQTIIARVYEPNGQEKVVRCRGAFSELSVVDLLETQSNQDSVVHGEDVQVKLRPWQIQTVSLR